MRPSWAHFFNLEGEMRLKKILIGMFCIFVFLTFASACYLDEPELVDVQKFYNESGEVNFDAVEDYYFEHVWYHEEAEKRLEEVFLDRYDVYGLYDGVHDANIDSIKEFAADLEEEEDLIEDVEDEMYYIINKSSKKYHTATCDFGQRTSEQNKEISYDTSEEIAARGYSPCGKCNP